MKITSEWSQETRHKWKIVRLSDLNDVKCDEILYADDITGECELRVGDKSEKINFGPHNIRLVLR